jgi:hypothetical protein
MRMTLTGIADHVGGALLAFGSLGHVKFYGSMSASRVLLDT